MLQLTTTHHFRFLFLFYAILHQIVTKTIEASNFNKPHHHQGKVTPYPPGDPKVKLDKRAIGILNAGKPYQTQITQGASGRALCVQDIHAPPSVVWDRILDFNKYATMVDRVSQSSNYQNVKQSYGEDIYTRMTISFPLLKLEYFIKHCYHPKQKSLVWTLDYDRQSDLDDSVGYWYVIAHPDKEGWSRVYYSVELVIFDWVPEFVKKALMGKALTDATAWVKSTSETQAVNMAGGEKEEAVKKRNRVKTFFRYIFFLDQRTRNVCETTANIDDLSPSCVSDEDRALHSTLSKEEQPSETILAQHQPAGVTRVVLVSLVSLLMVLNMVLFLERLSRQSITIS
mmetsp:Transcript_54080/g.65289  ORF Transcript_54080/g.65289 Transcript_54080/m.65289 type:complete len:342 (+) Transcript_54080:47-1072(+)